MDSEKSLSQFLFNDKVDEKKSTIQKVYRSNFIGKTIVNNLGSYILELTYTIYSRSYYNLKEISSDFTQDEFIHMREKALKLCIKTLEELGYNIEYLGWNSKEEILDSNLYRTFNRILYLLKESLDFNPRALKATEVNRLYMEKLPLIDIYIQKYLQDRIHNPRDKSRFASHLRILIRTLARELSIDAGRSLMRNYPVHPWGYYLDIKAVSIMKENGAHWEITKHPPGYYLKQFIDLGFETLLNDLYMRVYESSMKFNPVHNEITESNFLFLYRINYYP